MADVQISHSGPLFPKISLLDAKCCDFARLADFGDESVHKLLVHQVSSVPCFLDAEFPKIIADPSDFPPLTCSSLQHEMQEEEVQLASVKVASEKQAEQHGPLLRRNVEGARLGTAQCLKLGQTLRECNFTRLSRIF